MERQRLITSLLGVLACLCVGVKSGSYCTSSSWGYTYKTYCSYGCCGDYPDEYCCSSSYYEYTSLSSSVGLGIGAIIGIVCGCILFVSVIIALICFCVKSKGNSGTVVRPLAQPHANTAAFVHTGSSAPGPAYGQPGPAYGQPGPAYGHPSPAYGMQPLGATDSKPPLPNPASDPAYPPGGANPAGTATAPV